MRCVLTAIVSFGLIAGTARCDPPQPSQSSSPPALKTRAASPAEELTDAMDILKRADQALKRVNMVRYHGVFRGTGWLTDRTSTVSGTVILSGKGPDGPERYRIDANITQFRSGKKDKITIGSDSAIYYLIDRKSKTAYAGIGRSTAGPRGVTAMSIALPHFTHPNALLDEMSMDLAILTGSATVGGEDCYEIQLQNADETGETLWWFSKRDLLPRRRQIVVVNEKFSEAALDWVLTDLKVDPKFDGAPFKFVLPEGYRQLEGQAP